MPAQDYGDLADYQVNGDNYTRVDTSTWNTLVIAGQWGEGPLVASVDRDTYWPIDNDCPVGNCALFAHDIFTGLFAILSIASYDGTEENCLCALASMFLSDNVDQCKAVLQKRVDDTTGTPLWQVFPPWILAYLNLTSVQFSAVVAFDYWFTGCYGGLITIPNLPVPAPPPPPPILSCYCGKYPSFR